LTSPNILKGSDNIISQWSKESQGQWEGPYFFIQGADTQFGMIESFGEGLDERGWSKSGGWEAEIKLLSALIDKLNAMQPKPRFFIICGDLVDAYPMDEPRRSQQEKDFKATLCRLDVTIPVVCVCGNHDVGDRPTAADLKRYTDEFGDDYFDFWLGGVHYVVINSQIIKDPSHVPTFAQKQEAWLERTLDSTSGNIEKESLCPCLAGLTSSSPSSSTSSDSSLTSHCRHTVAFMHIPPFLNSPEEPDDIYFNLPSECRAKLLRKLYDGGIRKVFCGHYHRNAGGNYGDLEVIVTSAVGAQLGTDVSGARVVRVLDNEIHHQYYAIEDLPDIVEL